MTPNDLYAELNGNYEDAKARLMNDKLITKFVLKYPNDPSYDTLVEAWDSQDGEAIFKASHALKGVAANLSFTALFTPTSELCEMYRNGALPEDPAVAADLMQKIKDEQAKHIAAIAAFSEAQ